MKQKDILLIAVVVIISGAISIFLSNILISAPKNRQQTVEVVSPISSQFPQPDSKYFNSNSIDTTQLIQIGQSNNTQPFNGTGTNQ